MMKLMTNIYLFIDLFNLLTVDPDETVYISSSFVAYFYDPKGKSCQSRDSLNKLRTRKATLKDTTLARLPTETSFKQHVLRALYQTIWLNSHKPHTTCIIFGAHD